MIEFLSPVSEEVLEHKELLSDGTLGKQIKVHKQKGVLPELEDVTFAIIGVQENRSNIDYVDSYVSFDSYRKAFYSLYPGNWSSKVVDLGDILKGDSVSDSRFALKTVVSALLQKNIIPLILGAGQDLVYAQYRAYDTSDRMVNMVNIDNRFDLGNADMAINNKSYVGKIVVDEPYNLFNYTVLGYQSFLNPPEEIALMDKLFFDAYRLGELTADITLVEPAMRDADIVTLDASAIKSADLSYENTNSPNGFDGREICNLARYAGISNKVTSFGVYEIGGSLIQKSGAMLIAQILWYFIEGVNFRIKDDEFDNDKLFTTYIVPAEDFDLVFKKSNKTERWWIEIPIISTLNNKIKRRTFLPCTYDEYLSACNQEIPERWLKARRKNEV